MVVDSNATQAHEQLTLLLSHEISAVITAMRYNSKWAVVPRYYEEDRNEPSRYDDAFRTLLSEIYLHEDWSAVDPMLYLTPFLSLIKASDVSGPITGAAAVALQRILGSNLITPHTVNAEAAINQIVEDSTQCKFESTNNAQDEVVLLNIVQVLEQAVQCNAGVLLSDDTLCKSFQAAFMLGDPISKPKEYGDIMGYYSRQACGSMVRALFTRLRLSGECQEDADGESLGGRLSGDTLGSGNGGTLPQSQNGASKQAQQCRHGIGAASEILDFLVELIKKDPTQASSDLIEETIVFALDLVHTALLSVGHDLVDHDVLVAQVHVELLHAICQAVVTFPSISIISGFCQIILAIYTFIGTISIGQIELVLEKVLLKLADGKGVSSLEQQEAALEGILELVRTPGFIHDVFVNCDCRLQRGNLFVDLVALLSRTALPHSGAKTGGGGAVGAGLGPLHAVSLEALLAILRAIAAENKPDNFVPPPPELELPCFVDIWSALAAGEHPDLTPLMRAAPAASFPSRASSVTSAAGIRPATASSSYAAAATGAGGQSQNRSSLDQGAAAPVAGGGSGGSSIHSSREQAAGAASRKERLASGAEASASGMQSHSGHKKGASRNRPSDYERLESAVYEKHLKGKVMLAVEHFNKDHKKGFQYLQATRLMPVLAGSPAATAATAAAAAAAAANGLSYMPPISGVVSEDELAKCLGRFLHVCPRLNKVAIGELLGEPDAFYLKVLDAYTASFNFHDLRFDAAIRLFLESFRLPGEAQKIDRIINSFGNHFYDANPGIFRGPDAAYVLAYSVIMLNTDRHNAQVKNKMSLESFRRNLRGVNEGADFPMEFLNDIYHSIAKTPLRMSEDSSLQISEQQLMELHQLSCLPRGQMVHADPGRHLFDVSMFRLMWQPTVTAMAAIVESAQPPPLSQVLPSLAPDLPALERGGPSPLASVEDLPAAAGDTAPHTLMRSQDGSVVAEYPGTLRSLTRASQSWPGGTGTGPIMPLIDSALDGLQVAASIAAQHSLEDVTDTVLVGLTRLPIMNLAHLPGFSTSGSSSMSGAAARGDVALGKDAKLLAVTRTVATITSRYGDCLGAPGWESVLEMVVVLYRSGALPDTFCSALAGDGEGGLVVRPGEAHSLRVRRAAAAKAQAASAGTSIFRSITSILGGSMSENLDSYAGREYSELHASPSAPHLAGLNEEDSTAASVTEEVLCKCAFEDIFIDSKFLKQESLGHLMHAIIHSSGPIPRPAANGTGGGSSGGSAYAAAGAGITGGWDVAELCLELLFTMLLRNRDRISALWPRVYAHFQTIFSCSREVEPVLVQKAVMAMMRLCQRLLPYKPDITESLVKGVQLVSLVDEQVASDMASTIASEVHDLLKGAAPYLATQQVWMAIMGLIKIIQYDPSSFLACVDTLAWVAAEALTPLNFAIVLQTTVDLLERAAEYASRAPSTAPGSVLAALDAAIGSSPTPSTPSYELARAQLQQHAHVLSTTSSASTASAPEAAAAKAAAVAAASAPKSPSSVGAGGAAGGTQPRAVRDPFSPGGGAVSPRSPTSAGDPVIGVLLGLLRQSEQWLEVWWLKGGGATHPQGTRVGAGGGLFVGGGSGLGPGGALGMGGAGDASVAAFKQEAWSHVMSCLCRAIKSPNLQIRNGALECLQRSVVAAEKFSVPQSVVQRVLMQLLVPMTQDLVRKVAVTSPAVLHREFPHADVAVRELVRALAKVVLLYAPQMKGEVGGNGAAPLSSWGPAWRGILDCLVAAMTQAAPRSELLAEAIPEATKNMVLMLLNKGVLPREDGSKAGSSSGSSGVQTWRDASDGSDLCELTWRAAKRVSANLTPALLV